MPATNNVSRLLESLVSTEFAVRTTRPAQYGSPHGLEGGMLGLLAAREMASLGQPLARRWRQLWRERVRSQRPCVREFATLADLEQNDVRATAEQRHLWPAVNKHVAAAMLEISLHASHYLRDVRLPFLSSAHEGAVELLGVTLHRYCVCPPRLWPPDLLECFLLDLAVTRERIWQGATDRPVLIHRVYFAASSAAHPVHNGSLADGAARRLGVQMRPRTYPPMQYSVVIEHLRGIAADLDVYLYAASQQSGGQ
jgi:hypothetical protein